MIEGSQTMEITIEIIKQIQDLKKKLYDSINELPDNPKINRLSGNCFTIMSSDLSVDRVLSPEYYDFKHQYREIIKCIDNSRIETLDKVLNEIVKTGIIKQSKIDGGYNLFKLNPTVIEYLKQLLKGV